MHARQSRMTGALKQHKSEYRVMALLAFGWDSLLTYSVLSRETASLSGR